ncbi:transcription initiation factor IID, TAF10 subunit [Zopfia rhizophila CBS 207.26]|uniref:Transcription initiation factor TFIID subunit 10 n=1 Tax=Zopfia rhizophila CBS 207.26 TaxID=1314779 RepID=A0A6A6EGE4_9PEZI|nr:transcription initiation factor IID, TAF10 subunit [Zopfia rhizophila CBS 207.26]
MADRTQLSATDPSMEVTAELDALVEGEINANATQPDPMNLDGSNDIDQPSRNGVEAAPPIEARIPAKKDATLREFLNKMDENAPIIPDAVTNYYLTLAGLPPPPQTSPHLARLLALATQKFIADIAADAYQYSRIRSSNSQSNNPMGGLGGAGGLGGGPQGAAAASGAQGGKDGGPQGKGLNLGVQRPGYGGGGQGGSQGRTVLTMEDLGMAVGEYGVNIKRGEFYR